MLAASVFALLLAECSRVPVDDPTTHLELTMIHEVMVLDHSGPDLALILYAGALKLSVFGVGRDLRARAASRAVRRSRASRCSWAGCFVIGAGVGIVEASMARLRLPKVPLYLVAALRDRGIRPRSSCCGEAAPCSRFTMSCCSCSSC